MTMPEGKPKVVTLGGGHGQAALLAALRPLPCHITAIVSVADDGGCSGKLREDIGMPPPGDLRRCLTALARDRYLAEEFELRLFGRGWEGRCAGNLALSDAYEEYGSLQKAVDWAADLLKCVGRVVPVAESPGVLVVYDFRDGRVEGESRAESLSAPMVARVDGPIQTNPVAIQAIHEADLILLGPGSFFTSTIATVTTANVAEALVEAKAPKVLLANLVEEAKQRRGFSIEDDVRILRDHLTIASMGGEVQLSVLEHVEGPDGWRILSDGTPCMFARLALPTKRVHEPQLLSDALVRHLGLPPPRIPGSVPPPSSQVEAFQKRVQAARKRWEKGKGEREIGMELQSKLPHIGMNIFTIMSDLATKHQAINLGQGFPDFSAPTELFDALERHMREGRNQYAPMTGVQRLREEIVEKTKALYGRSVDVDKEITVTSGGTEALFAAFSCVLGVGDEAILLDPCYDSYAPAVNLNGARSVRIPLNLPDFSVDWQRVKDSITPKTRMILINSPHNPAGSVLNRQDLDTLAEMIRGTDILVISDEVYEHIIFDGVAHQSVLAHDELAARSFVISSFGKTYHCTGWKVGYCVAPEKLSAEFRKAHQYLTFCTFHAAQWALADILASKPSHYLELPKFYEVKRDFLREGLSRSRFKILPVAGGYFQLVDYSEISDLDDDAFCRWLVEEHKVAAVPLSPFYEKDPKTKLIRLCFAKREETLAEAAERLCRV